MIHFMRLIKPVNVLAVPVGADSDLQVPADAVVQRSTRLLAALQHVHWWTQTRQGILSRCIDFFLLTQSSIVLVRLKTS